MLRKARDMAKLWTAATADAVKVGAEAAREATGASLEADRAMHPAPPAAEADPTKAAALAGQEREARDAARAPYLAPGGPAVAVTRLTDLKGDDAAQERMAALGFSSRPELVFGAFRSPDLWMPRRGGDKHREWVVLHDPGAAGGAPGPRIHETVLDADEPWVRREEGEPAPVDEEVGALFAARAGLAPHELLGISRVLRWTTHDMEPVLEQRGVRILHLSDERAARKGLERERPVASPPSPSAELRLELLWWGRIREATREGAEHEPRHPSPAPHLPVEVPELLTAYLEVVGVQPAACLGVGAGVSRAGPRTLDRQRMRAVRRHVTDLVTVIYRDSPAYAEGRERWAAYCAEQYGDSLEHPAAAVGGERYPVRRMSRKRRAVEEMIDVVDPVGQVGVAAEVPAYC